MTHLHAQPPVVRSLEHARIRRDLRRFQRLQVQFARLGFYLDPLSGDRYLVQRWGLYRVLDLDEAEQLLRVIGRSR